MPRTAPAFTMSPASPPLWEIMATRPASVGALS